MCILGTRASFVHLAATRRIAMAPNRIVELLGMEHPIIQAPMMGLSTPEMVAAANRAHCLGSLALGDADARSCAKKIREVKQLSSGPFAVNIFVNDIPPITQELKTKYDRVKAYLSNLSEELEFEVRFPEIEEIKPPGYKAQIPTLLEEGCQIISFTFGCIDKDTLDVLRENSIVTIGTCTSLQEAQILHGLGVDILCVQGIEAGGHRGSFVSENIPHHAGFSLLQNVRKAIPSPLVYAGGIRDKTSLEALSILGAEGFQVGTLLLCSEESSLAPFQKERIKKLREEEIILTKSFSGRYARGVQNTFIALFENSEYILPYPYQNKLTKPFRAEAKRKQAHEWLSIWVGESFQDLSQASTETILKNLISP